MKYKLLFIAFVINVLSCKGLKNCSHIDIPVINNSDTPLYCYFRGVDVDSVDTSIYGGDPKSDGQSLYNNVNFYYVRPNGTNGTCISSPGEPGLCMTEYFSSTNPKSGIEVFFFDSAVIYANAGAWDSTVAKSSYLKRKVINYQIIDSMGWKIFYP